MRNAMLGLCLLSLIAGGCSSNPQSANVSRAPGTPDPGNLVAAPNLAPNSAGMIWVGHLASQTLIGGWEDTKNGPTLVINPDGTYYATNQNQGGEYGRWALSGTRLSLTRSDGAWRSYTITNPRAQDVEMRPDAPFDTQGFATYRRTVPTPPTLPLDPNIFKC